MKKARFLKALLIAAVCGTLALAVTPPALAGLMIMPIRVAFTSRDRMQDITVINVSNNQSETYRMSWLNVAQTETGDYKRLDQPLNPEFDPETAVLFSPRQVSLPPGGKQRVRMSLRRPAGMADGEYRVHLYLKSTSRHNAGSMSMNIDGPEGQASANIGMGMNVGIAVPVIVRQGTYDGTASIGAPRFIPASADGKKPPLIEFTIERGGKFSTIGNVMVYWTPPDGGKEILIARRNAVNIFHEVPRRLMKIPLKVGRVAGGTIRIVFEGDGPDKGITFDDKKFPVGG